MRDLESTDLASAERLERQRAMDEAAPDLTEFEIAEDGHPTGLALGARAHFGLLDPENAPDPCEIGEHPDQEDGWCLACGEWVRPYPEDF
jgi:hypothetical protein